MDVTLLILTLNEIEGVEVIMPRIKREWCSQILILDGGSTDGTIEYAREHGYEIYIQKQKGFRHAYIEALPLIRGEVVITFSPDGNSIPELIPTLIDKVKEGYDMVIASRYCDGAKSEDDDIITAFGNWLFTRTINLLYDGHYTDALVIYRAYKKEIIYDLDLHRDESYATAEKLFSTKISWEPLLSVRAAKRKLKIAEIPGDEPPRIGGERKLKLLKWGAAYYFQFLRELFFWR
ncbi:MAG: histidinol phosphate phosphatase [Planctomycetes bacterium RBG_16_41_13]|nr:MAG: histidinol phosphate phosphatase [Planctomycetes bacterium RBG_16_41_13]